MQATPSTTAAPTAPHTTLLAKIGQAVKSDTPARLSPADDP